MAVVRKKNKGKYFSQEAYEKKQRKKKLARVSVWVPNTETDKKRLAKYAATMRREAE